MNTLEARLTSPLGFAAVIVAAMVLWVMAFGVMGQVMASHDPASVHLHEPHRGASSTDFQSGDGDECASTPADQVVWHFVANKLTPNSILVGFTAQFASGARSYDSALAAGPSVWHIYVSTTGNDRLDDATATFDLAQRQGGAGAMLVLSHVCVGSEAGDAGGGGEG